jgi:hypothetical protein
MLCSAVTFWRCSSLLEMLCNAMLCNAMIKYKATSLNLYMSSVCAHIYNFDVLIYNFYVVVVFNVEYRIQRLVGGAAQIWSPPAKFRRWRLRPRGRHVVAGAFINMPCVYIFIMHNSLYLTCQIHCVAPGVFFCQHYNRCNICRKSKI